MYYVNINANLYNKESLRTIKIIRINSTNDRQKRQKFCLRLTREGHRRRSRCIHYKMQSPFVWQIPLISNDASGHCTGSNLIVIVFLHHFNHTLITYWLLMTRY